MAYLEYRVKLAEFRNLTPTVFQLSFEMPEGLKFNAGQFVSMVLPGLAGGRDLRRAYSVASSPESKRLDFCIKQVDGGLGTTYLKELKVGDTLRIFAPYGTFVYKSNPARHVIFISTGTGISPFRSILFSKHFQETAPKSISLLLGVRDETEILYDSEFSQVPHLNWIKAVSRPINHSQFTEFHGRVTDYFKTKAHEIIWSETDFYLCGNGAMIDEIKKFLAEKGVAKEAVHQEIYYKPKPGEPESA